MEIWRGGEGDGNMERRRGRWKYGEEERERRGVFVGEKNKREVFFRKSVDKCYCIKAHYFL